MEEPAAKRRFGVWKALCRVVLLVILTLVGLIVYFHLVGIPQPLIRKALDFAKIQGLDLNIERGHFDNWNTVHLENLTFTTTNGPGTTIHVPNAYLAFEKYGHRLPWTSFRIPP